MEFIIPELNSVQGHRFLMNHKTENVRNIQGTMMPPSKMVAAIWDKNAVEPALLRVPLLFFLFLLLWSANIYLMEKCKVPYSNVLSVKSIHYGTCFFTALAFVGLYSVVITFNNMYEYELENGILVFYLLSTLFLIFPFAAGSSLRVHFFKVLRNVILPMPNEKYLQELGANASSSNCAQSISIGGTGMLNPILTSPKTSSKVVSKSVSPGGASSMENSRSFNFNSSTSAVVPFEEILLADALCSLSKIFKDIGTTIIVLYAFLTDTAVTDYHYHGMILIAILASLPFIIRVRQCSIQLFYASDNTARLLICTNIFKYVTSFPSIWITAFVSLGWYNSNDTVTTAIFLAGLNSTVSFLWDIGMDWGLISISFSTGRVILRNRTFYYGFLYFVAVCIDLVLRFTWAINRVTYFSTMHPSQIVLIIEVFEVFRRSMWNMIRIEWEIISQEEKMKILERSHVSNEIE